MRRESARCAVAGCHRFRARVAKQRWSEGDFAPAIAIQTGGVNAILQVADDALGATVVRFPIVGFFNDYRKHCTLGR